MTLLESDRPLIDVRNVSKEYTMGDNRIRALESVSLTIARGEFVSVMGPSGSGKINPDEYYRLSGYPE